MYKDRFGNRIGIRKNNVVIIHDKTVKYQGLMGLSKWGTKKGSVGLVKGFGCVMVQAHKNHGWGDGVFQPEDLEVIGTL